MAKNLEDRFTKPPRTRVPGDQILLDYQCMAHAIIQQLNGGKFDSNSKPRAKHSRYVKSLIARTTTCVVAEDPKHIVKTFMSEFPAMPESIKITGPLALIDPPGPL